MTHPTNGLSEENITLPNATFHLQVHDVGGRWSDGMHLGLAGNTAAVIFVLRASDTRLWSALWELYSIVRERDNAFIPVCVVVLMDKASNGTERWSRMAEMAARECLPPGQTARWSPERSSSPGAGNGGGGPKAAAAVAAAAAEALPPQAPQPPPPPPPESAALSPAPAPEAEEAEAEAEAPEAAVAEAAAVTEAAAAEAVAAAEAAEVQQEMRYQEELAKQVQVALDAALRQRAVAAELESQVATPNGHPPLPP